MILLATNDLHLASKPPVSRIDSDYPEEIFELLAQVEQLAVATKARAVLIAGDIFHVRHRIGWDVLIRFVGWCSRLKENGTVVLAIPGNHDLRHDRYDSLNTEALGLLFSTGALVNVSVTQGCPLWRSSLFAAGGPHLAVAGVPFPDAFNLSAWTAAGALFEDTDVVRVVMGHCFGNMQSSVYYGEPVHAYAELLEASRAHVTILGHDHTDRGVIDHDRDLSRPGRWTVDLGALSRGSLGKSDTGREIKIALIDTHDGVLNPGDVQPVRLKVTQVRLKYRPASEIFDLALRDKVRQEREEIAAFVAQLRVDLNTPDKTPDRLQEFLSELALPETVLARVVAYIEAAEAA